MSGNPLGALLSQQKVKAARQKCSCASCQKRPNFSAENYGWVSTINENYQREVIAKMEEEKRVALAKMEEEKRAALAKRRAMIKMKKATKMNPPSSNTNVTSSSSTNMNSTHVMCRSINYNTTTSTSITTMPSSIRSPPTPIRIPKPLVICSTKISERGLGSLPTTNSTTTISTRSGTACTTTTSTSTSISIASIRPVVQWQVVHCPYSALSYLDRVIVTAANNSTNTWFQAPCGRNNMRRHM